MADQQSIEGKRMQSIETMVIAMVSMLVVMCVVYYYYEHPWYYFNRYFYMVLDYIPDVVNKWIFFWQPKAMEMIPLVADDLAYHAADYSAYYAESEVGTKKMGQINYLSMTMMWPYCVFPVFFMIYKELRRQYGQIKSPLEKNKSSALYRYAKSQADIWPYIKPVVNIMGEMVNEKGLDSHWYALSEIPLGWMKRKELFREMRTKKRRKMLTVKERAEFTLDRKKAYLALLENLGPLWKGVDALDFNYRCVLAIIVPHVFGKVAMSRLLNRKLCNYHETKKSKEDLALEAALLKEIEQDVDRILSEHASAFETPYFEEDEFEDPFDPILSSFEELDSEADMFAKGHQMVQDVLLKHAYAKTVMFALFERSWTYGVLASAELLWVKKVDRELWYVLSQQGRTSAFVEVCGAWAHYLAEDTYGFRTLMPQVEEGIYGLDYDLWSTHSNYTPHVTWEDQSKWDRLVPDGIGKGGQLPRAPGGTNAAKVI